MGRFAIGKRLIGDGEDCFIIAEAGVNHNGSIELAERLVDAAVVSGADAVKFQTFIPSKVVSSGATKADYQKETTGAAESQLEMLERLALDFSEFARLKQYCDRRGIIFLSTPFDRESADFLDELGMVAFKIPSGELVNLPFLAHIGAKAKPAILSTGMGSLEEVRLAVDTLRIAGCAEGAILHCVSNYPAEASDANLRAMLTLAQFGQTIGYSDHTMGLNVALASVAMGAKVLEKHFTLDRTLDGPDHRCSLEPGELLALVRGIREIEAAFGDGIKRAQAAEIGVAQVARRSLFTCRPIAAGTTIVAQDLDALRPGDGISPAQFSSIIGCKARYDLPAWHKLALEDLK